MKEDQVLIRETNELKFEEVDINKLPKGGQYLNLQDTSKLVNNEVLNKYIVDNEINFSLPRNITYLFYNIVLTTNN